MIESYLNLALEKDDSAYTVSMRSVADDLRRALGERLQRLPVHERVALAARLAEDDLRVFAQARGLDEREARGILTRARRLGRRPSAAIDALPE